jgi:TolB protein
MDSAGGNRRYLGKSSSLRKQYDALVEEQRYSPDHRYYLFVRDAAKLAKSDDIWVTNADGTKPRNLTPNSWQWDKHPSWSPDSRRIVFWSNREGHKQIHVMEADGQNVRNISNTEWEEYDPIWIP